ncbi:tyrosine-type recombinase/integrase [Jannaschia seohaensis]|uniref:Integrase n=1 Tax=Jannaschia seohaensis TaxID=475081 RepID=A0A2Y9B1J0_9RHOB|nr:site-specific integrase [Jannaschia seohaensis]PWJ13808.1 integrase [Jannaschia seohaensis]SSA50321.1 Integrase [Jannaschia seohaensis]
MPGDGIVQSNSRKPDKALSARFVETVAEPGKYFDGQGLFLRVAKNGSRQWVQRITIRGKRCELGLGSPPAVTLAMARKVALENRGQAMLGGDPLAEKRKVREGMTFADAVDRYLAAKLSEFRNEKHRKQWRSTLDNYAVPKLGPKLVSEISVQDVLRVLEPIWQDKTETASRLRGRIENVLSWATVAGHRTGDNPARWRGNLSETLPKPAKVAKSGNQPALALGDVSAWWADLSEREGMAAQALRFLTMTAARSGEVRGMTWDELDLGDAATPATSATRGGVWTIPASRMKNGRPHRVPLTAEAVALLEALPRLDGSPYVFFAPKGGMLSDMSISAVMRRMQAAKEKTGEAGYLDPVNKRPAVPHGLRSTFRQWAAERGYPRDMAEIALAHFIGSEVERAYQRSDMLDRRRDMMAAWARVLEGGEDPVRIVRMNGVS